MGIFLRTIAVDSLRGDDVRVAEVPVGLKEKAALLSWYKAELEMPAYFGSNWDALDECLRDLSWLPERNVVIYHRDVPLTVGSEDQKMYIDILSGSVQDWVTDENRNLIVAFDPACELPLRSLGAV